MAKTITLLAAVNASLKRVDVIEGSSGELTTFTDSARQTEIDVMLAVINEVIAELYATRDDLRGETAEGTFTLVADDVDYALPSDFVRMVGDPVDETNNRRLTDYPGGFKQLRVDRIIRSDYTGPPRHWTINPSDDELEIDTTPTADEAGDVYTFLYEAAINLTGTTDTFPVDDEVTRELYAAFAQAWRRERNAQFDDLLFQRSMARAAQKLYRGAQRNRYGVVRSVARA